MIPPFDEKGNLPQGIHWAEWTEFKVRFGINFPRQRMIQGLELAMTELKKAGCQTIYINGSFVTELIDIGKILIKLRIGLKMTPSTLAMLAGLNEQDLISYEKQEYQNASFIDILTISDVLGIKINDGTITASLDNSSLEVLSKNTPNQQEKLFTLTS